MISFARHKAFAGFHMVRFSVQRKLRNILVGLTAGLLLFSSSATAQLANIDQSSRGVESMHRESSPQAPTPRVQHLIEQGRAEAWDADDLFRHLELEEPGPCYHFAQRDALNERLERWQEAVWLLAQINQESLNRWLLGLSKPPKAATAEIQAQLQCLTRDLLQASLLGEFNIRLFPQISAHFGGQIKDITHLAQRASEHPTWLTRTITAMTRSDYRDMNSQGFIWYRKFQFTGRNFNRVSHHAAQRCRIGAGQTWKTEHPAHQRCWQEVLSPQEREQEILSASAAPGLSRHHWGTDFDLLGLNPQLFIEGGPLFEDWRWLNAHALDHGFFQPYGPSPSADFAHMEERWHWSYLPVGQALWGYIQDDPERFEVVLFEQWDRLERRWGRGHGPFFDHMRAHWRSYLFYIDVPALPTRP